MSDAPIYMCMTDAELEAEIDAELDELYGPEPKTWADFRRGYDRLSEKLEEWQGLPVPLGEELPLRLAKGHPYYDFYAESGDTGHVTVDVVVGDCPEGDDIDDDEIVNYWYSAARNIDVWVVRNRGRYRALTLRRSPGRSMDRLGLWLRTTGAADAWDLEAEYRARDTLRSMLTERQWMHYDLTGAFFETSPRSNVTYVFRRLRPTIAMSPRGRNGKNDMMRVLAVLCMHPIGYYEESWAGCMVPSDDVIAHLSFMRGDEARYWSVANQHQFWTPEAGL